MACRVVRSSWPAPFRISLLENLARPVRTSGRPSRVSMAVLMRFQATDSARSCSVKPQHRCRSSEVMRPQRRRNWICQSRFRSGCSAWEKSADLAAIQAGARFCPAISAILWSSRWRTCIFSCRVEEESKLASPPRNGSGKPGNAQRKASLSTSHWPPNRLPSTLRRATTSAGVPPCRRQSCRYARTIVCTAATSRCLFSIVHEIRSLIL